MVDEMGWWAIPIVSLVMFTLYGIEGIGSQLEDPFGYDRNDIKMDALVGDSKTEIDVVLREWRAHCKATDAIWKTQCQHGDRCLDGDNSPGGEEKKFMQQDLFLRVRPRSAM